MTNGIPRPEYPRPQLKRDVWINLNGEWQMETDRQDSGFDRRICDGRELPERITVPFCRECKLSGIGDVDFCEHMWYRKAFVLPEEWKKPGHVLFNVGACDYKATVFVNDIRIGEHSGGYSSFSVDITDALHEGENVITVKVDDNLRLSVQPSGKQSKPYWSGGAYYRRTTGFWQTVWLEYVPEKYITNTRYFTDIERKTLTAEVHTVGEDEKVYAKAYYDGKCVGSAEAPCWGGIATLVIDLSELHLWEVGNGRLYDIEFTFGNDKVKSYFGMRKIEVRDGILFINGKAVFQRLVLDQGFYPDGIYTPETVGELYADVDRSMACGFNGARLHQKVFEPLFLEYCDKKGYIVWGEFANWGINMSKPEVFETIIPEWLEVLQRDFNHPSIIGWCPINESHYDQNKRLIRLLGDITKSYDPTRAYIDVSGYTREMGFLTDIYDCHQYTQDPEEMREYLAPLEKGEKINCQPQRRQECYCDVTFVSEYGGIAWNKDENAWGYGNMPESEDEFIARFKGLADAMLDNSRIGGFCYTQLTDVEQEQNGLYYFDRKPKFDPKIIRNIISRKAKAEEKYNK